MEEPNATDSLVLAATNNVEILDEALARRFDEVIEYGFPDCAAARTILEHRFGKFKLGTRYWSSIEPALEGLSQAELVARQTLYSRTPSLKARPTFPGRAQTSTSESSGPEEQVPPSNRPLVILRRLD
jgi:hypothetical protein